MVKLVLKEEAPVDAYLISKKISDEVTVLQMLLLTMLYCRKRNLFLHSLIKKNH